MDLFKKLLPGMGNNSFIMDMLADKLPELLSQKLPEYEQKVKDMLKAVPLEEGETHASYAITEYKDRIVVILATYKDKDIKRIIEVKPFDIAVNIIVNNLITSK